MVSILMGGGQGSTTLFYKVFPGQLENISSKFFR